jgi:hypothetical protein
MALTCELVATVALACDLVANSSLGECPRPSVHARSSCEIGEMRCLRWVGELQFVLKLQLVLTSWTELE